MQVLLDGHFGMCALPLVPQVGRPRRSRSVTSLAREPRAPAAPLPAAQRHEQEPDLDFLT